MGKDDSSGKYSAQLGYLGHKEQVWDIKHRFSEWLGL